MVDRWCAVLEKVLALDRKECYTVKRKKQNKIGLPAVNAGDVIDVFAEIKRGGVEPESKPNGFDPLNLIQIMLAQENKTQEDTAIRVYAWLMDF